MPRAVAALHCEISVCSAAALFEDSRLPSTAVSFEYESRLPISVGISAVIVRLVPATVAAIERLRASGEAAKLTVRLDKVKTAELPLGMT